MGSLFAAAMAAADVALDATFGEPVLIEPRAKPAGDPDARVGPHEARPARTIIAGWIDPKATIHPTNLTGHPESEVVGVADDKPSIDFASAALPYALLKGDWVTRIATGERFAAGTPTNNGFTRTSAPLTARRGRD